MDDVESYVRAAVKASVFVSPNDPGLTRQELVELGSQHDLFQGEIEDTVRRLELSGVYSANGRLLLSPFIPLSDFLWSFDNDPRNWKAFEFVHITLRDIMRREGQDRAFIDHSVLIDRGIDDGHSRRDMEVAVAAMLVDELLEEKSGRIKYARGRQSWALPSKQIVNKGDRQHPLSQWLTRVIPSVKDLVDRRSD